VFFFHKNKMYRALWFVLLFVHLHLSLDTVDVQVSTMHISDQIPPDFASFSYEISGVIDFTGSKPDVPKASFVQLLNNLRQGENVAGPILRIGGNSADTSWWDPDGKPMPPKVTYDIKPNDLISVVNVAKAVNGSVVFDLSMLQSNDPIWAVNHLKGIQTYVGFDRVRAVEIGNEPDIFYGNGLRPRNFTFTEYESEWQNYANALYEAGLPKKRIQGATFCCKVKDWDAGLPSYMKQFQSLLSTISYHRYPLTHCNGHNVTLAELMADKSTIGEASFLEPFVKDATALGLQFYVGEGNSASCGGMPNVSNVFGASLWAVDFLFNLASLNIKGINFHGGEHSIYTAIDYNSVDDPVPGVKPLYYAMWVFSEVIKYDAQILQLKVQTSNPLIKVWGVENTKGITTIVAIHKDLTATESAKVSISPSRKLSGEAHLSKLMASTGVYAKNGISYAGLTFDGSKDGQPVGTRKTTTISPSSTGAFEFELEPKTTIVLALPSD